MICIIICFGFTDMSNHVVVSEFCEVWRESVKNELRLTRSEVDALQNKTKLDIATIKRYAKRHCK